MTTAVFHSNGFARPVRPAGRTAAALRSLMQLWEQEAVVEEAESETELMIVLSGMVGPHATARDGQ